MPGLKTSTFWRAIRARRNRRISSSVLPLNMEPVITSMEPCSWRMLTSPMWLRVTNVAKSTPGGSYRKEHGAQRAVVAQWILEGDSKRVR